MKQIEEGEKYINCGKPLVAELVDHDFGKGVPLNYRAERYNWKCIHCGFVRHHYYNCQPPGHYTGN